MKRFNNESGGKKMGTVSIGKNEDIVRVKNRINKNLINFRAFPAKRFMGKIKLNENPLAYQKRLRKEWDESPD